MKARWFNKIVVEILFICVLLAAAIFAFVVFERSVNRTVSESSTNFLKETAFLYAGTFKVKLNDQLFMLESQARYFADIDMDDYNAVKETIISTKGVGEFKRIAVASTSGMTVNYDGKSSGNILMKDYFKRAMQGHAQISSNISIDEDGEKVLTLAVPIFQQEKVVGVITGTFAYAILDNIFSVDTFDGHGYSFIVDKEGAILISSSSPNRLCFSENLFAFFRANKSLGTMQLDTIDNDMQSNLTNIVSYSVGGENRIVVYTPIGLNDWYVFSAVNADYILAQQRKITKITVTLIVFVGIVFILVAAFIINMFVQKFRIEKENSRYAMTSEHTQTLIFEYDFDTRATEFTGNTEFVLGKTLRKVPAADLGKLEELIHESERSLFERIKQFFASGQASYTAEFRLKEKSGEYAWYRLSGTLIRDKESAPLKFIGNIVNVNTQVMHEQELKTMAETDGLSGLLNKVYMEKHVSKFLSQNAAETFGAFYIIDLDNFKQVNDRLGHTYGDLAISDTATKLSLVFSERDFIGRIGGDEFCVFLCLKSDAGNPLSIVEEKAKALKSILAEVYSSATECVKVTPSIGIALFPEQGAAYKELFKKADIALYHVKNSGKNNFAIYDESMKQKGESVYV